MAGPTYEQLISPESLSYARSGSGRTWHDLWLYYNEGVVGVQPLFFSPVRYWAFNASGTLNDAVVTWAYSSSHPSYSENTIEYLVAWTPATLYSNYEDFFRTYLTESTAYQISTESPPAVSGGLSSSLGDAVGAGTITWRNDVYQGTETDNV